MPTAYLAPLAPGRRQIQYIIVTILQNPVFLLNSCSSLLSATHMLKFWPYEHSFSRSYGVILPSSFNIIPPIHLNILYPSTCVGLGYGQPHTLAIISPQSLYCFSWDVLPLVTPSIRSNITTATSFTLIHGLSLHDFTATTPLRRSTFSSVKALA